MLTWKQGIVKAAIIAAYTVVMTFIVAAVLQHNEVRKRRMK